MLSIPSFITQPWTVILILGASIITGCQDNNMSISSQVSQTKTMRSESPPIVVGKDTMVEQLTVTVLADNTVGGYEMLAEFGFSLWIEADGRHILFDTGLGRVIEKNAQTLGIDLATAEKVVLSHGHVDHTAGLPPLVDRLRNAELYVHPAAFEKKYALRDTGKSDFIGLEGLTETQARAKFNKLILTSGPTEIAPGVWVTGQIPRTNDYEDVGGPFYLDETCKTPDSLHDDQALFIRTRQGTVVVLGCGHAGVINTLDYVCSLTGDQKIYAVLGGMHLHSASRRRLDRTVEALKKYDLQKVGPSHCTGFFPMARLHDEYEDRFMTLGTGRTFKVPQP